MESNTALQITTQPYPKKVSPLLIVYCPLPP